MERKKKGLDNGKIKNTTYVVSDLKGIDTAEYINNRSCLFWLLAWDNYLGMILYWVADPEHWGE